MGARCYSQQMPATRWIDAIEMCNKDMQDRLSTIKICNDHMSDSVSSWQGGDRSKQVFFREYAQYQQNHFKNPFKGITRRNRTLGVQQQLCLNFGLWTPEFSLVYLLFPTCRETLQGVFLELFNLFSWQFSVYFPNKKSREKPRKSLFSLLKSF